MNVSLVLVEVVEVAGGWLDDQGWCPLDAAALPLDLEGRPGVLGLFPDVDDAGCADK